MAWGSNAAGSAEALRLAVPAHSSSFQDMLRFAIFQGSGPQMPIKPVPVSEMDLARARQIVRSLEPLKGLTSDDAEIVTRAIAQSFAEGRRQGLEIAKDWSDGDWRHVRTCGKATAGR
jgi:hypothetical protein